MSENDPLKPSEESLDLYLQVGTADIVNIGVAEYENRLREQINQAKWEWTQAKAAAKQAKTDLEKALETQVQSRLGDRLQKLQSALIHLDFNGKIKVSQSLNHDSSEVLVSVQIGNETLRVEGMKLDPEVQDRVSDVDLTTDTENAKRAQMVHLQNELQNLPYVERQIRAEISKAAVTGSAQGKQFLKALEQAKARIVPALPPNSEQ